MKVKHLLLSGLIAALSAAAFGGGNYKLEFKYILGNVSKYKNAINMEIRSASLPGGKMVMTEESIETSKVVSVNADGSAEVESSTSSFVQKVNGEKTPASASMLTGIPQDTLIVQKMSKTGRILSSRLAKDLPLADKVKVEAALRNMKDRGIKLPEKALQMGESWKSEEIISNEVPGMGVIDITLAMQYTLSSEEKVLGFKCVKILLAGSGSGTLGEGKGDINIKMKGALWIAPDKGELIKVSSEETDNLKIAGPNGQVELDQIVVVSAELIP